jgi:CheY-like chemotaxis protein
MMTTIPELKILVVEDEDSKIGEWQDAIESHNADQENKGFRVRMVTAKSVEEAKQALDFYRLDAAVVDLRLQVEPGVGDQNSQGNDLVRHILEIQPLGVVVYTGQLAEADVTSYDCPQVRIMDKAEGLAQVFSWLAEHKDVFLCLRGAKSAYSRETAKIFFRSIWPRWSQWTSSAATNLTEVVARHVVAHVHDALLNSGGESTHPEEAYFVPPIKDRLDTGDLVDYENNVWIIVTPRCDLSHPGKVETILLARCDDISLQWNQINTTGGKSKENELRKLTQHGGTPKQHFLHPMRDAAGINKGPWMAQFHNLKVLPAQDALEVLTPLRFASLSPLFIPSLVERFGAYYSRIGTPDYFSF